jgi:hypothetical protein
MHGTAELLHAIASLAWPLLALLFLLLYKPQLVKLLERLKRGRFLGQELEFELDQLDASATAAQQAPTPTPVRPKAPPPAPEAEAEPAEEESPEVVIKPYRRSRLGPLADDRDVERTILDEAEASPKLALITLSAELERVLRRKLAASQAPENWERQSLGRMVTRMELPADLRRAVRQFSEVRNRIVHGHGLVEDDVALRALDSGLKILNTLQAIPVEEHVVRHPSVEIFADEAGTEPRDIHGVVLDNVAEGVTRPSVFPTRQTYVVGQMVTWEWDDTHAWPESWYRNPDTNQIEYAWSSSIEFAGRPLEEI